MDNEDTAVGGQPKSKHHGLLYEYYQIAREHITLLLGLILISSGLLRFKSGRYCDGNPSDFFTCTNSATYYYYPTYTIVVIVVGVLLVALWKLKGR